MCRRFWIIGLALTFGAVSPAMAKSTHLLAENGVTDYVIVVDADAPAAEHTAARELKHHLEAVTGAVFPLLDTARSAPPHGLYVGGKHFQETVLEASKLGPDGICVVSKDGSIYFGGQGPRGALYAVYEFLEEVVGVHWWTPSETEIPVKPVLEVPAQKIVYTPPIQVRETFYFNTFDPVFAARNRLNGHFQEIPESYGGHHRFLGWCHTFFPILPPEEHFAEHPDWYSMIDGERVDNGQLCLTNMQMREAFIRVALEWIRKDPGAGMISISQNDWARPCTCPACAALAEKEGSEAGPLIHFVNAVAEAIEAEYPDFIVETLAYQYTRKAPRYVRPRDNVAVRLCSIECDFSEPLATGKRNKDFLNDIREWSRISSHLYIWNYVTNFSYYLYPQPNWDGLAPDLNLFVKHKAIGVFEQGDRGSTCGDFHALRPWVLARLLWDPSRDTNALITTFLDGYYGAAGAPLREYIEVTKRAVAKADIHFRCFRNTTADWLTLDDLNRCTELFDEAGRLVAGDPILEHRLEVARMPLDFVWLDRYIRLEREATQAGKPFLGPQDPVAARDAFLRRIHLFDCTEFGEGHLFEHALPGMMRLFEETGPVPDALAALDPEKYAFRHARNFQVMGGPPSAALVKDAAATGGLALSIPGHAIGSQVRCPVDPDLRTIDRGECYIRIRVDALAEAGPACAVGIHDLRGEGEEMCRVIVNIEDLNAEGYTEIHIPRERPKPNRYYFVEALGNPESVHAVLVDGLYLVIE